MRRNSFEHLATHGELFELLIESSADTAIFIIDPGRIVTSRNVGAERLFGYLESEMVGSSADVIFTPEDRSKGVPEEEQSIARAHGRAADERWHQRKDG